jgi:hypothetical protein
MVLLAFYSINYRVPAKILIWRGFQPIYGAKKHAHSARKCGLLSIERKVRNQAPCGLWKAGSSIDPFLPAVYSFINNSNAVMMAV